MNSNPSASTLDVEAELPLVNSNAKENGNAGVRKMRSRIISAVALSLAVVGVTVLVASNQSSSSSSSTKRTATLDLHKEDGSSTTNMKSSMGSETKLRVATTEMKSVPVTDVTKNQKILEQAKEKMADEEDNEDENDREDKEGNILGMKTTTKPVGKSAKKAAKKEAKAAKKEEKVEKKESKKKEDDNKEGHRHRHLQTLEHTPEMANSIGSGALINAFAGSIKKAVAPILSTSTLTDLDAIAASKNAAAAAENKKNLPGGLANGRGSSVSSIVSGFSTGTAQTPFAPSAAAAVPVTDASKVFVTDATDGHNEGEIDWNANTNSHQPDEVDWTGEQGGKPIIVTPAIPSAGAPSKSPSAGLHKPTWKPSYKPVEHSSEGKEEPEHNANEVYWKSIAGRKTQEATSFTATVKDLFAPETTRATAGSPTKSPSAGLHKPTWKPSSKPAEHSPEADAVAAGLDIVSTDAKATTTKPAPSTGSKSRPNGASHTLATSVDFSAAAASALRGAAASNPNNAAAHGAPRALIATAGSPTKSPSSGFHKPTWKPSVKPVEKVDPVVVEEDVSVTTPVDVFHDVSLNAAHQEGEKDINGSGKYTKVSKAMEGDQHGTSKVKPDTSIDVKSKATPVAKSSTSSETHRAGKKDKRRLSNSHPGDLTTSTAGKGDFAEVGPSKSPSTGIHKPTWKPTQGKPSGKPVEPWKEGVESSHTEKKNSAHSDGEISKRVLRANVEMAGVPTKSPSSGIHKPTWKPSSKPAEHRSLGSKSSSTSSSTTVIEDLQKSLMKATKKGDYEAAATIGKELIAAQGTTQFEEEAISAAAADKAAAALKDTSSVAATTTATVIVEAKTEKVDPSKVARTSSTATSISRGREGVTTSTATSTTSSSRSGVVSTAMPSSTAAALQAAALANSGASHTITHRDLSYTVNDKVDKLEAKLVKVEKEGKTETAERIEAKIAKYIQDPTYVDPATVVASTPAGPAGTATGEKPAKLAVDPQTEKTDKTVAVPAETLTEIPSVPVSDGHHAASEERTEGPKGMDKRTEQNAKLGVSFAEADEVATTTETAVTTETMEEAVPVPTVVRKLSSKSKGKDSRPTMTPRTDKPSDRVTRRLSSKEEKLEAKLAKAEKKGDEKLEAKLEKKIEKLSSKSETATATEEVTVVAEVVAEPMQAVAPVEEWVADVVDNTAITTTDPVVATPATPTTTTNKVPASKNADAASREAGPKGAAKKLAHDGSPETTVAADTTVSMSSAIPVPTVVRQLSKKSKAEKEAKKAAKKSLSNSETTAKTSTMATSFLSVSPVLNLLEALPSKADKAEKKSSSSKSGDGPSSSSDTETGAGTGPTASVRESQKEAAIAVKEVAEKEEKTGEPKIADPPKEEEVKEVVEEEEWVAKADPGPKPYEEPAPKPYVEPGPLPEPVEGEVPPDADPDSQPGFVPANGPNEHAHDEKLSTEIPETVEADYTLKTDSTHHSSFNSNSEDNLAVLYPPMRKLSSKSKGKDSRPTMTPRTDKPSDRVTRRLSSKEEKLEAKLVKAEKKGDEKLEAKLEKKIEKLSSKSETATATEEVTVVAEVAAEPMQAVAPVEEWVADVVDNTAITTTDPVVATPATPTTTTNKVPASKNADAASREAGPKGAAKKLAHDGSPETTVAADTTVSMSSAIPVPIVVRQLSSKSKGKDSRPTMTPRTDKPSDRVTRRQLSKSESKEEKLEAKLAKAEKKGDEKLEAKLEKKIEKLSSKSETATSTEEVTVVEEVAEVVPEVEAMTSVAATTDSTASLLPSEIAPRESGPKGAVAKSSTTTSKDTPKTLIPPTTTTATTTTQMSGPSAQKAATATTTTTTTTDATTAVDTTTTEITTPVVETATVESTTATATSLVPPAASITAIAPPSSTTTKPAKTTTTPSTGASATAGKPAKTVPPPTTVDTTAAETSIDASTIAADAVRALGSVAQKSSKKTVAVMDDLKQVKGSVSVGAAAAVAKASANKLISKSASSSGSKTLVKNTDAVVNSHRQMMGQSSRGEPPVGMQAAHPTGVKEAAAEALKDKVPVSNAILSTPIRGDDKSAPVPNTAHQMGEIDWLYRGGSPTKSPSAGLHKPTWKPSFKPVEHSMTTSVYQGNSVFSSATNAATPSTPVKQSSPLTAPKTITVDGVSVVPTPLAEYGLAHPRPGDNTLFRN